jgi:hypothetical protein
MKKFILLLLFVCFVFSQNIQENNEGLVSLKGIVLKNVLLDAIKGLVPSALRRIMDIKIPDVKGETSVTLLGMIDYTLSEIKIADIKMEDVQLITKEPCDLEASL